MRISTEIGSISKIISERKAVEYVARAGFDAWDFSMLSNMCKYDWESKTLLPNAHPLGGKDYLGYARELKKIGLDNGIVCNQSHAPFPLSCMEIRSYLKRAIECTAEAGGKTCVIHPHNDYSPEQNAEIYLELLPFAKDCGVKIATENMWNWDYDKNEATSAACSSPESFKAHLDAVNDDFFVACVDVGHAEMRGLNTSAPQMIEHLGSKVAALHLHDNDLHNDSHELPFELNMDFDAILKSLKRINYKGDFTLEAGMYLENKGYTEQNVLSGLKEMAAVADKLRKMFNSL